MPIKIDKNKARVIVFSDKGHQIIEVGRSSDNGLGYRIDQIAEPEIIGFIALEVVRDWNLPSAPRQIRTLGIFRNAVNKLYEMVESRDDAEYTYLIIYRGAKKTIKANDITMIEAYAYKIYASYWEEVINGA